MKECDAGSRLTGSLLAKSLSATPSLALDIQSSFTPLFESVLSQHDLFAGISRVEELAGAANQLTSPEMSSLMHSAIRTQSILEPSVASLLEQVGWDSVAHSLAETVTSDLFSRVASPLRAQAETFRSTVSLMLEDQNIAALAGAGAAAQAILKTWQDEGPNVLDDLVEDANEADLGGRAPTFMSIDPDKPLDALWLVTWAFAIATQAAGADTELVQFWFRAGTFVTALRMLVGWMAPE